MRHFPALLATIPLFLTACAQPLKQLAPTPLASKIAVIPFQNCPDPEERDCDSSGIRAARALVQGMGQERFRPMVIERPVGATQVLGDSLAAALALAKGYPFVIHGWVDHLADVAPMTFRPDRAELRFVVLRSSDRMLMATYEKQGQASNLSNPDAIMEDMGEELSDGL